MSRRRGAKRRANQTGGASPLFGGRLDWVVMRPVHDSRCFRSFRADVHLGKSPTFSVHKSFNSDSTSTASTARRAFATSDAAGAGFPANQACTFPGSELEGRPFKAATTSAAAIAIEHSGASIYWPGSSVTCASASTITDTSDTASKSATQSRASSFSKLLWPHAPISSFLLRLPHNVEH